MKYTVKQLMSKLNINQNEANGFLRVLAVIGAADITKLPNSGRGKPTNCYVFSDDYCNIIFDKLQCEAEETAEETPVTTVESATMESQPLIANEHENIISVTEELADGTMVEEYEDVV